jgi:RNA recognition motif-containing protein
MTSSNPPDPQQQQPTDSQPSQGKRIIIRNLPVGTTREELRELGDRYGRVIGVELVPRTDSPFGFVSFLSEDDAEFSIYRLNGYRYKGSKPLRVALSNSKPNNNNNKPNNRAGGPKDDKTKKNKKPVYSLRTLTPLNPPTPSPQQQSLNNSGSKPAWDNPATQAAPASLNNSNPPDNGYVQPPGKGPGLKNSRRNNPNRNNRGNKNYKPAAHQQSPSPTEEVVEEIPITSTPEILNQSPNNNGNQILVTEVQITIVNNQWSIKLGPEQLEEFLKVVEPYLQNPEIH